MAIGWLTALKFVPWGEVIEAAPHVVNSARKFFTRTQDTAPPPTPTPAQAEAIARGTPLAQLESRLGQLEARLNQVAEQQNASAALIQSLAEQNAALVQTIDALRKRSQLLLVAVAVLSAVSAGMLVWSNG